MWPLHAQDLIGRTVNEESWKEAVSAETDWLELRYCGKTEMLQVPGLVILS